MFFPCCFVSLPLSHSLFQVVVCWWYTRPHTYIYCLIIKKKSYLCDFSHSPSHLFCLKISIHFASSLPTITISFTVLLSLHCDIIDYKLYPNLALTVLYYFVLMEKFSFVPMIKFCGHCHMSGHSFSDCPT
jgi:hypothetical protein